MRHQIKFQEEVGISLADGKREGGEGGEGSGTNEKGGKTNKESVGTYQFHWLTTR